jgi:uncharacterized protein (TIGR03118 family)
MKSFYQLWCQTQGITNAVCLVISLVFLCNPVAAATLFSQTNLITNDQSVNTAQITDPNLKNPWGFSSSSTGPFGVSDNATGVSTLYRVNPTNDVISQQALIVTIPGDGSVTGQVFNSTAAFNSNPFLFVSEDGTVSGWRATLGTTAEILQTGSSDKVYKAVAEATVGSNSYLYATNFKNGSIDVIKGNAGAPDLAGNFTDPTIPAGYAPFNIQNINGSLYVTYALQDANKHDDVAGAGNGFVSIFDTNGNFLKRLGSQGKLNSPWGLALAPTSFGEYAGDLLVGNSGDGTINVFDLAINNFVGQLMRQDGNPLSILGLWGLGVGNDFNAGSSQRVYFTAGPNDETAGLFGVISGISNVPEPKILSLISLGMVLLIRFTGRIKNEYDVKPKPLIMASDVF